MKVQELLELARSAVEDAVKGGATEAEAMFQVVNRLAVDMSRGIDAFKSTSTVWISVRTVIGKKTAIYATTSPTREGVREAVERSLAIARASDEDPNWHSLARGLSRTAVDGIYDVATDRITPEEMVDLCEALSTSVRDTHPKAELVRGILTVHSGAMGIVNSYGDEVHGRATMSYTWVQAAAREGDLQSVGEDYGLSRSIKLLDVTRVGRVAAERAVKFLKARPISTEKMDLILDGKVAAEIMHIMLSGPISASWVQEGRSPLANRLGERIAVEGLTIVDDGTMPGGIGSKEFDDEGVPTRRNTVVEAGILKGFLYDNYTAKREGRESTGNAHRSPWSRPQPSPNNLIVKPGDASLDEIIAETRRGLLVVRTIGEWLSNPISGQLNATVTQGVLIENGEEKDMVKGVIVSGNFWELLRDNVELIGRELEVSPGPCYAPPIKISGVTIAGR